MPHLVYELHMNRCTIEGHSESLSYAFLKDIYLIYPCQPMSLPTYVTANYVTTNCVIANYVAANYVTANFDNCHTIIWSTNLIDQCALRERKPPFHLPTFDLLSKTRCSYLQRRELRSTNQPMATKIDGKYYNTYEVTLQVNVNIALCI